MISVACGAENQQPFPLVSPNDLILMTIPVASRLTRSKKNNCEIRILYCTNTTFSLTASSRLDARKLKKSLRNKKTVLVGEFLFYSLIFAKKKELVCLLGRNVRVSTW